MDPPRAISTDELLAQAGWVRALARRLARDAASAEDVAQGTLAAALERPPSGGRPLRPWLARVAANLVRKERRSASRREALERAAARSEGEPASDRMLAELEEQQRLARRVVALPEPYRSVILRRYYRGESAAAIARATGVPAATVRSQLARGLERLRADLVRSHGGDSLHALGALALASSGEGGWLPALPIPTTTQVLAMSTGTKVAVITTAAALVCLGTFGARALLHHDGSGIRPGEPEVASQPDLASDALVAEPLDAHDARVTVTSAGSGATGESAASGTRAAVPPATVVLARALDEAGLPIAGAWLGVTTEAGLARDFPPSAESGADGRVALELPKEATWQYSGVEHANAYLALHGPAHETDFFVATVERGDTRDQGDLALAPGGGVAGRVIDAAGAPVEGALVIGTTTPLGGDLDAARLGGPETEGGRPTVRTGADGSFEIPGIHVGEARVWAHGAGALWSVSEPVTVAEGAVARGVTLALEPVPDDARIAGTVVDPAGAPVEGAEVVYLAPQEWEGSSVTTDVDGRFAITVSVRADYGVYARDPKGRFGPSVRGDASPGDGEVVIELTPRRTTLVFVVDSDGAPLEGAWVVAFRAEDEFLGIEFTHTDEEGSVELEAKGEPFFVKAGMEGYEAVKLGPFAPANLPGELALELASLPMLRGRVLAGEEPVAGARVELGEDHASRSHEVYKGFPQRFFANNGKVVKSDEDGRFAISMRADFRGTYVVLAEKEGYALAEVALPRIDPSESYDGVLVQLTQGGVLEGRVLVPAKRSREGIVIAASRGDNRPRITRTDADGRYRFERLTPGPWRVEDRLVEPEGRVLAMATEEEAPFGWNCEVVGGETSVLDIDLRWQADLRVEGRLAFDGAGAEGWSAVLEAPDHADRPYDLPPGTVGADGRFSIEARPGLGTVVFRSPAGREPAAMVHSKVVVDAERRPVELDLATGSLAGRIPAGASRLRVFFRVDAATHFEATFETDAEGDFRVEELPAGNVSLQRHEVGTYGPGWYGVQSVDVVAGETTTLP